MKRPLLLVLPALLAAAGCEQVAPLAEDTLEKLATAPTHVGIRGVRLHEFETSSGLRTLEDEILTDGEGGVDLALRAWNGMSQADFLAAGMTPEWDARRLDYDVRKRYTARFRDFAVADPADALENYAIDLDPAPQALFGRPALRAVFRNRHTGRSYEILWDAQTSVVLVSVERDAAGVPLSRTKYLEFEVVPDPAPILQVASPRVAPPEGYAPLLLPLGFRHVEAWGQDHPTEGLVRVDRYTDGIDHLFVTQRPGPTARPAGSGVEIRHVPLGVVRILEADAQGRTFSVIGRLPVDDLLPVLGSLSG